MSKTMTRLAGISGLILLVGCNGQPQSQTNPKNSQGDLTAVAPQSFPAPIVTGKNNQPKLPEAPVLATVPVPGLMKSTKAETRVTQAAMANKRDPFATLLPSQTVINLPPGSLRSIPSKAGQPSKTTPAAKSGTVARKSNSRLPQIALKPLPTPRAMQPIPSAALPPLAVNPLSAPLSAPMSAPVAPPSLTELAENVEITGVVQVGDRIMAIAKAPNEVTSRYVQQGDYLSGGQVLLKEIRMQGQGEPIVILQQNGRQVIKSIGSTAGRMAAFRPF
ncbi:hypothetical protein [Alkalinema sp. FACHB-956]|uniref:hypothetical protein n=1 Tax=Alkalinema sp. FACHB-956 TaxID=2692768 RepID=UPI0016887132|nr:hypothetical protein [Alkalinema sp. FACHB-956]MBD2328895.1 hypothetical protein [Alkalinema sp. FACHB-956]